MEYAFVIVPVGMNTEHALDTRINRLAKQGYQVKETLLTKEAVLVRMERTTEPK